MTTPYNESYQKSRRAILGFDMNVRTPGEWDSWMWPQGDRNRNFWSYADKYDASIAAHQTLADPLELPPAWSEATRNLYMANLIKRLAHARKQHERHFTRKIKKLTWGRLRHAQLLILHTKK